MRSAAVVVATSALILSGCISTTILGPGPDTTRGFACAMLDPDAFDRLLIEVRKEPAVDRPLLDTAHHIRDLLVNITGREPTAIDVEIRSDLEAPESGWSGPTSEIVELRHTTRAGIDRLALRIWWIESGLEPDTGLVPEAGLILVSEEAVRQKAAGHPLDPAGTAILLHHLGHALAMVNDGIPMQQGHEATPKHEGDISSVMHQGWHNASTPIQGGIPDHYSDAVMADWHAAIAPGGACA